LIIKLDSCATSSTLDDIILGRKFQDGDRLSNVLLNQPIFAFSILRPHVYRLLAPASFVYREFRTSIVKQRSVFDGILQSQYKIKVPETVEIGGNGPLSRQEIINICFFL
jgi:hypothetical protein